MKHNARVLQFDASQYERLVVISDIHGADGLFSRLLEKVGFSARDALILLGDYAERGERSLPLLRHIMRLSESGNVFALAGNCDTLLSDLFELRFRNDILRYMRRHTKTVLHEMLAEQGCPFNESTTLEQLQSLVKTHYAAEYAYLDALPHIIQGGGYTFVHAGLETRPPEEQSDDLCMRRDDFFETAPVFSQTVVVGHRPCQLLPGGDSAPVFDYARNIIFIDGGVSLPQPSALNALIIEGSNTRVVSIPA